MKESHSKGLKERRVSMPSRANPPRYSTTLPNVELKFSSRP